ncbi:hypothetical protein ITP53_11025 [Nonomuraea sp. K274]|uniref:Uncharacterized protein n=1 Tax=Nonomuraea cypriaca TaxID=1187855 RepID=A0A931AA29_9ACTN|nr:hypothetical protein [Nonomuraea cypriaca]MBF8186269.1 hypothetical protein [Nonomuraea cypriaca]
MLHDLDPRTVHDLPVQLCVSPGVYQMPTLKTENRAVREHLRWTPCWGNVAGLRRLHHRCPARRYGGRSDLQDKRHHVNRDRRVLLPPDLVHYVIASYGSERPAAVVDSKYKITIGPAGYNDDPYPD